MRKLITVLAVLVLSLSLSAQDYQEISTDSVRFETDYNWTSFKATKDGGIRIKVKVTDKVVNIEDDAVISRRVNKLNYTLHKNDTLLKVKWISDTTYNVKDTFLILPTWDQMDFDTRIGRLVKRANTHKVRL